MKNIHTKSIPDDVLAQVKTHITAAIGLLEPYTTPLNAEERHDLPKMGAKMMTFVDLAFTLAKQNPNLLPSFLKIDDFGIDYTEAAGLFGLLNSIQQAERDVADIQMLAGSEALQAALVFYRYVKEEAAQDIPGALPVFNALKAAYPNRSRRKKTPEEDANPLA